MAKRKVKLFEYQEDHVRIPLSRGFYALIDFEDVELASHYNWYACVKPRTVYARVNVWTVDGKCHAIMLHELLTSPPEGKIADHENGDGLDCRRRNLRIATRSENACNRRPRLDSKSGVKGVYFQKNMNKWAAAITKNGKRIGLGHFETIKQASVAYAAAAETIHGEFKRTHFDEYL
jgi:hypothetical protein